jgi:predicted RNA-binding protein YlxR (DUF448 family)
MKRVEKNRLKGRNKRHIPIRTCISCGIKRDKKELIRLVLDAHGSVVRDDNLKRKGRGVYVCPRKSCWEDLEKDKRLMKAFRKRIPVAINEGHC